MADLLINFDANQNDEVMRNESGDQLPTDLTDKPNAASPDLLTDDLQTTDRQTADLKTTDQKVPGLQTADLKPDDLKTTDSQTNPPTNSDASLEPHNSEADQLDHRPDGQVSDSEKKSNSKSSENHVDCKSKDSADEEKAEENDSLESRDSEKKRVLQELNKRIIDEQKINSELISKLHLQLDNAITEKEELVRKLGEKESDLAEVEDMLKQQKERLKQLEDVESTNSKLKALAVKLKKELAEVKENQHKDNGDKAIKDQLKQQISNFNNLQKEHDKLHDDYESAKKKVKNFENDLSLSLRELNAAKIDLSNLKHEHEKLERKCQLTESHLNEEKERGKELASKIIILNNKLDEERKKSSGLTALERQIGKLNAQLESKQNEIVELQKRLKQLDEANSDLVRTKEDHQMLKALNESLTTELNRLRNENQELISSTNNRHSEFESLTGENRRLADDNEQLNGELASLRQSIGDSEVQHRHELDELRNKLALVEQQLSNKESEFNSYRIKVTKVLNEKNNGQTNEDKQAHLKELSSLKRQLDESLESSGRLKNELHTERQLRTAFESELTTLKSDQVRLRDDASKLVIQQNENQSLRKKLGQLEQRIEEESAESRRTIETLKSDHCKELEQYEIKIRELTEALASKVESKCKTCNQKELSDELKNESGDLKNESSDYKNDSGDYPRNDFKNHSNHSDNTDLDSLENTSVNFKTKRLSTSTAPDLDYVNPLQEILSQSNAKTVKAELLDQLNELLKESESNNSLLTEQNRLLKEEVRRLERSIERTEIAKNLEYFKNILIKFLSFENNTSDGSERTQLVPVLKTILKLSKEEEIKLKNFATFMQDAKQFNAQSNGPKSNWSIFGFS